MLENWDKILVTEVNSKAELTRMLLESNDISAVILNKKDRSYLLGVFEVYVPKEEAILARKILDEQHATD